MNKITKIQAITSGALVLATIFLVIVTWNLAKSTSAYLKETAKMREIMNKEFKMRNKPAVGVKDINYKFGIEDTEKIGKKVFWNLQEQEFYCESSPIEITGIRFDVIIKNFTSEPATKVHIDVELWIDNTLMPKTVIPEEDKIIMPLQEVTHSAPLGRNYLINALKNKKEIILKIEIKYSDLSEREDIFEFYMETNFDGTRFIIKKSHFKDKRQ